MKSNTIFEHENTSASPAVTTEEREHKVYKIHLDPSFFTVRKTGIERIKLFLLSLPLGEQSTWTFEDAPTIEESSDIDTEDGRISKLGLGISLKIERNSVERTKRIVLKIKGMDPLVVDRFAFSCVGKKFVLRKDLVFSFDKSLVSKALKCKIKKDLCVFQEVYDLFPGLKEVLQIPPETRLVYSKTTSAFKLTSSSIGFRPVVRAQIAVHYANKDDAISGIASFSSSLSLRVRKMTDEKTWIEASRSLYALFFRTIVNSPLYYKGPVLKAPCVDTPFKVTREYALFLQPSKWENRDEAVKKFSAFLQSHSGFASVDLSQQRDRVMEHFSLDTPQSDLKASKAMEEAVIKFERNVDARTASITCKYKGFDREIVAAFPVRVSPLYLSSSKLELDCHVTYARNAISLVASVPYDIRLTCFADIERIFPGFLKFSGIDPSLPVVVRLYKVKYEICKQVLNLPCGRAAIGRISLEYPSIDEARASQNMFNGEWTFRLLESAGWEVALHEAMTIFHQTLCKSPYNYEGPSNKPDQRRVAVPQLEDTSIPEQKTVGLIVLARISHDGENPWRILLLRSNTEQLRLSGSTWDVPKGRMDASDESEIHAAFRELAEETGLTGASVSLVNGPGGLPVRYVAARYPITEDGSVIKKTFVLFLARFTGSEDLNSVVKVSNEHAGFVWKPWNGNSEVILESKMFETCLLALRPFLPKQ